MLLYVPASGDFKKGIMAIFLRGLEDIQSRLNEGKELGERAPPGRSLEC